MTDTENLSKINGANTTIEQSGQTVTGHQVNIVGDAHIGQVGDRYEIAQAQIMMPQVFAEAMLRFLSAEQSPDYTELDGRESWEPETVLVAAGTFLMGSKPSEGVPDYETPQFEMTLPAYRIGKYPVTNAQYFHFIRETKRIAPKELGWTNGNAPAREQYNLPVRGVTWYGALVYCYWLMEVTKRPYTLPSEAQWEKAARGEASTIYPWGNQWQADYCNTRCDMVTAVDAFPEGAGPYGCLDMVGNVREWTTTLWGRNRKYNLELECAYPWKKAWKPHEGYDEIDSNRQIRRVTRGGAALLPHLPLRSARRESERPYNRGLKVNRIGFRVALNWEKTS